MVKAAARPGSPTRCGLVSSVSAARRCFQRRRQPFQRARAVAAQRFAPDVLHEEEVEHLGLRRGEGARADHIGAEVGDGHRQVGEQAAPIVAATMTSAALLSSWMEAEAAAPPWADARRAKAAWARYSSAEKR